LDRFVNGQASRSAAPMDLRRWLQVVLLSAPPLLVWAWLLVPSLQPKPQHLAGPIRAAEACLVGWCRPVVSVGSVALSCQSDLLGAPYACPDRLLASGVGTAKYFVHPTVSGLLGLAPTAGVLIELERDGQVVFRRSIRGQVFASMYGGWAFHAIYWPIVGFVIWRWPHSRISRRAQWLPSKH
jgi:hypothetical protein